jgi:hypothetical protein
VLAANAVTFFYIFGEFLTVGVSYFVRDYDQLTLVFAAVMGFFPLYFWYRQTYFGSLYASSSLTHSVQQGSFPSRPGGS